MTQKAMMRLTRLNQILTKSQFKDITIQTYSPKIFILLISSTRSSESKLTKITEKWALLANLIPLREALSFLNSSRHKVVRNPHILYQKILSVFHQIEHFRWDSCIIIYRKHPFWLCCWGMPYKQLNINPFSKSGSLISCIVYKLRQEFNSS